MIENYPLKIFNSSPLFFKVLVFTGCITLVLQLKESIMIDFDCFILYSDEQLITIASHILNGTIDQNMEHAKYLYHQIFGDDDFMVSALGFAVMGELRLRNVSGKGKHEQTSTWKMWFNTGQKMINAFKAAAV